jgi:hypothetical protein
LKLAFDLDNVIYPFVQVLGDYAALSTGRPRGDFPDATKWEFYEDWGMDWEAFLDLYCQGVEEDYVFRQGQPIDGALRALRVLQADGHTIHLITDRFIGYGAIPLTEGWLYKWDIPYDTLTFAADKTIIDADILFDDRPSNVDAWRALGRTAFLFPHNGYYIRDDQVGHPYTCSMGWGRIVDFVQDYRLSKVTPAIAISLLNPLQEALNLVHGARQESYGHPYDNFTQTGRMWGAILNVPDISPEKVAMMMEAAKISRETHDQKYDNLVDIAGYVETHHLVIEERKRRERDSTAS